MRIPGWAIILAMCGAPLLGFGMVAIFVGLVLPAISPQDDALAPPLVNDPATRPFAKNPGMSPAPTQGVPAPKPSPPNAPAPKSPPAEETIDWSKCGNEYIGEDYRIWLPAAQTWRFSGSEGRRIYNAERTFALLCVENKSPSQYLRWRGWQGRGKAFDNLGNECRPSLPNFAVDMGLGFPTQVVPNQFPNSGLLLPREVQDRLARHDDFIGDGGLRIPPGKLYVASLFFEPVAPTATELRLALPDFVAGRSSKFPEPALFHFCVPITREKRLLTLALVLSR